MKTLPQELIWGGNTIYMENDWPGQLQAFTEFLGEKDDPYAYLLLSIGYMGAMGRTMCKNSVYYTKVAEGSDESDPPASIVPFSTGIATRIAPMSKIGTGSIKSFAEIEGAAKDGARYSSRGFSLRAKDNANYSQNCVPHYYIRRRPRDARPHN
jgi:hypothetical protein